MREPAKNSNEAGRDRRARNARLTRAFSRRFAPRECGGNSRTATPGTNRRENQAVKIVAPYGAATYRRIGVYNQAAFE